MNSKKPKNANRGFMGRLSAAIDNPVEIAMTAMLRLNKEQGVRSSDDRAREMVWIPGGTFRMGSGRRQIKDPTMVDMKHGWKAILPKQ